MVLCWLSFSPDRVLYIFVSMFGASIKFGIGHWFSLNVCFSVFIFLCNFFADSVDKFKTNVNDNFGFGLVYVEVKAITVYKRASYYVSLPSVGV